MYVRLARPSLKYFSSFRHYVTDPEDRKATAAEYIAKRKDDWREKGKGSITQSEFWLIDAHSYLGRIHLWHEPHGRRPAIASHIEFEIPDEMRLRGLGAKLLALGLKKAKEFGIDPVLVGCEATNYPARRIIERNGGELLRVVRVRTREHRGKIRMYSISLSGSSQVVLRTKKASKKSKN
jgi:predicted acetyltransferase